MESEEKCSGHTEDGLVLLEAALNLKGYGNGSDWCNGEDWSKSAETRKEGAADGEMKTADGTEGRPGNDHKAVLVRGLNNARLIVSVTDLTTLWPSTVL